MEMYPLDMCVSKILEQTSRVSSLHQNKARLI